MMSSSAGPPVRHRWVWFVILLSPLPLRQDPVLRMAEGDTIYDYCWYPKMTSLDPETCL